MDLEYLDSLISSQRFHDALFYLKSMLENSSFSSEELIFLFSKQIELKKNINKNFKEEQRNLIEVLYAQRDFLRITKYYEENENGYFPLLEREKICLSYIEIGEFSLATGLIDSCIESYLSENLYSRLENFLNTLGEKQVHIHNEQSIRCQMYLCLGQIQKIIDYDEKIIMENLMNHKRLDVLLKKSEIKKIWNKTEKNFEKYFSNALQLLLTNPYDKDVLKHLLSVFYKMKRKEACEILTNILLNEKIFTTSSNDEEIIQIQLDIKSFEDYEYRDEVDLGTDLFFTEDLDEVSDLENKIALLLKMNDMTSVQMWVEKLREKDAENEFLKKVEEEYFYSAGTKYLGPRDGESGDLTKLLSEFSSKDTKNIEEEKNFFKKSLDMMEANELSEIYYDLCVGLMMMELADIVIYILEKIGHAENEEENIQREYLKICAFMSLKNYSRALNLAEECLEYLPLKENERIDFYYLIAECYRKIGRKIEALKYYARVFQLDQNYRLIKQRINERY